jgi:hypothetical protein
MDKLEDAEAPQDVEAGGERIDRYAMLKTLEAGLEQARGVEGQAFALVAVVWDDPAVEHVLTAPKKFIKVSGFFATHTEAEARFRELASHPATKYDYAYRVLPVGKPEVVSLGGESVKDVVGAFVDHHNASKGRHRERMARVHQATTPGQAEAERQQHLRSVGVDPNNTSTQQQSSLGTWVPVKARVKNEEGEEVEVETGEMKWTNTPSAYAGDDPMLRALCQPDPINVVGQQTAVLGYINHPVDKELAVIVPMAATGEEESSAMADVMQARYPGVQFVQTDLYRWHPWPLDHVRDVAQVSTPGCPELGKLITERHKERDNAKAAKIRKVCEEFYHKRQAQNAEK